MTCTVLGYTTLFLRLYFVAVQCMTKANILECCGSMTTCAGSTKYIPSLVSMLLSVILYVLCSQPSHVLFSCHVQHNKPKPIF